MEILIDSFSFVGLLWGQTGADKMLVPPHMIEEQSKIIYQINKYYVERVQSRMTVIDKTIREICQIVQDILREVEVQEPRFISSLSECNGRWEVLVTSVKSFTNS